MRSQSTKILLLLALTALLAGTASAATYKVRKGDSLDRIARRQHVSVEALRAANGLESDALKPGMKLTIPASGKASAKAEEVSAAPEAPKAAPAASAAVATPWVGYHSVVKGDTFESVAAANGLTVEELKKLNPGKAARKVKAGMRLRVKPEGATTTYVPPEPARADASKTASAEATVPVKPVQPPETAPVAKPVPAPVARHAAPAAAPVAKAAAPVAATTADEAAPAEASSGSVFHTIRKGDTFKTVAKAYGLKIDELQKLNPGKDSRRLKIGMKLSVGKDSCPAPAPAATAKAAEKPAEKSHARPAPVAEKASPEVASAAPPAEDASAAPVKAPVYHKVRKGDTYASIASKYGVSVKALKKLNHVKKAKKLKPGTQLLVRRGGGEGGSGITADRRRELERILQQEAALTAEGAALAAAQITSIAPDLLAAGDNAFSAPIVEEHVGGGGLTDRVIRVAKLMLDLPYRFGGTSLTGIDCSGYVQKVFGFLNIPLPRSAREQFAKGEKIDKEELETGDLVFFKTYARFPSHVGIYLGDNKFIHASSGDHKVKIDSLDTPYFLRRYIGARRLVPNQKDDGE
jgi:LysM repeat protein